MRPAIRSNAIRVAIRTGKPARGFHMNLAVPTQIELLGTAGFDFVFLDAEHGTFDGQQLEQCCRAAELHDLTIIARIPSSDENLISRFLNAGVQGIVVPHVDTVADAQLVAASARYAPAGLRPSGPARSNRFWKGVDDLAVALDKANEEITLSVQIESMEALERLPDMLDVAGIDYFTIGKQDLAQSMGYGRLDSGIPDAVSQAVDRATELIRSRGGRLKDDVMTLCRVDRILLDGARKFLDRNAS